MRVFKEINVKTNDKLAVLRYLAGIIPTLIARGSIGHFHYFLDEPWECGDVVIRVEGNVGIVDAIPKSFSTFEIQDFDDEGAERQAYGIYWDAVKDIFQAASLLGLKLAANPERPEILRVAKIAHCMANTLGYTIGNESQMRMELTERAKLFKGVKTFRGFDPRSIAPPIVKRGLLKV